MKDIRRESIIIFAIVFLGLVFCRCADKNPDLENDEPDTLKNDPVLVDTFDSPILNPGKWGLSFHPLDDGIYPEIVSSPTRAGSGAIKQTVQYMWNGEQNSNRCEIQAYRQRNPRIGQHKGYYQRLDESWTGFSIYFPSASWGPDHISKEIVFQLHGSADAGEPSKSPPLSLKVDVGSTECYWQVRWDENVISNSAQPTGPGAGVADIWRGPIDKDQWTDWIIHAIWDYANDGIGFIEIWRNGEKVATRNGPNMYNDKLGMRGPIFGIYKWDWKKGPSDVTERIIYHDEFRDYDGTASFEDVDPAQRD
jgi:hypothetical protein